MLDATSKKLLRLVDAGQPASVRQAVITVLAELDMRDKEATGLLVASLDDGDPAVRVAALTAVGKLRLEEALPRLLERVSQGGAESELAAQAAAKLGAKGTKALRDFMGKVAPGLRRRIAAALGSAGTTSGSSAAVEALLDSDPGVIDAAARTLGTEIPTLEAAKRRALADHLVGLLSRMKNAAPLSAASETAVIRLLGALGAPKAEALLWQRTQSAYPADLRSAALQALGSSVHEVDKDGLKLLVLCAGDPDFRVAAPALMILKGMPVSAKMLPTWLTLLQAPDVAVRRLALEKAGDLDRPEVAQALLAQLTHPDRGLRDEALRRLAELKEGHRALAEALLAAATPDEAWMLARAQAPFVNEYPPTLRERIFDKAATYLEAGDRRADALLSVLRAVDARAVSDRLTDRGIALRKKKKYEAAQRVLRFLARDPAAGPPVRMELAGCNLKLSSHDLSAEARAGDPCLDQFASLLNSYPDELKDFVTRAKWLEPEDLFYLGFHFIERERREKEFGGDLLRLLLKRSPKSKLAKDAKSKLLRQGLKP
jgi:HEAT repeat protein